MKQYLTYHMKWQLGIIVSLPCMYLFQDVFHWPYWATIVGFQFVGALVFWPIDKFIFNMKRSKAGQ
jgi:hypothetical protein